MIISFLCFYNITFEWIICSKIKKIMHFLFVQSYVIRVKNTSQSNSSRPSSKEMWSQGLIVHNIPDFLMKREHRWKLSKEENLKRGEKKSSKNIPLRKHLGLSNFFLASEGARNVLVLMGGHAAFMEMIPSDVTFLIFPIVSQTLFLSFTKQQHPRQVNCVKRTI